MSAPCHPSRRYLHPVCRPFYPSCGVESLCKAYSYLPLRSSLALLRSDNGGIQQEPVPFQYADTDNISAELDEFFGYAEVKQFVENRDIFLENYDEGKDKAVSRRTPYKAT